MRNPDPQPTVVLTINTPMSGPSMFTRDARGEILETVEFLFDAPDWNMGGICDHRGGGDFDALSSAITKAEEAARALGIPIVRVPVEYVQHEGNAWRIHANELQFAALNADGTLPADPEWGEFDPRSDEDGSTEKHVRERLGDACP